MNRLSSILFSISALGVLLAYLLGDLRLSQDIEYMTWAEVSSQPQALARFKEEQEADRETVLSMGDLQRLYEQKNTPRAASPAPNHTSYVATLRRSMHDVYRAWLPIQTGRKTKFASPVVRERVGCGLTFATLVAVVVGLSVGIRACTEKSRP